MMSLRRWCILFVLLPAASWGREAVGEFNTRGTPPNIDVLWQVSVTGDFIELSTKESGLILTAASGNFSVQQVQLNPIGGGDRPSIVLGEEQPYWTARFDAFGVVYELTIHQPITQSGEKKIIQIPIALQLLEEQIERMPVIAEFRNLRVQGNPDSQNLDYTFDLALMGTYCPNDVTFFIRADSLRSESGATDKTGEFKPIRETLPAGTTTILKDVRVPLFGPKQEDRQGIFRMTLVGRDSRGNLVTVQCEVPLRPPWANPGAGGPSAAATP